MREPPPEEALADGETPEALEGIGWAGQMLNEDRLTFDARERAYRLYLDRGDTSSAARIAAWLAADYLLCARTESPCPAVCSSSETAMRPSWMASQPWSTPGSRPSMRL